MGFHGGGGRILRGTSSTVMMSFWGEVGGRERAPGLNVSVNVKGRSPTELTLVRDALIVIPVSLMKTSMNYYIV